jgi:hypothetical protein
MIPSAPSVFPVGMFRLYLTGSSTERIFVISNRTADDIVSGPHQSESDARKWMKKAASSGLMGITKQ